MWTIYAGGQIIDHPNLYDAGYTVADTEIDLEINTHGSMKFTVPCSNPAYDTVKRLGTIVTAERDGTEMFRGRVAETSRDFYNSLEVYCEGQLAFLCDSMLQPFAFKGSVAAFLQFILDTHNACVADDKKLYPGNVTVTDPDNNGILVRSSDSSISCWDAISGRLIDMLGGYIMVRKSDGKHYVDYLSELTTESGQAVKFGENLLNLEEYITAADVVTVLYPFGARIEEDGTNENSCDKYMEEPEGSGTTLWHGNRVTVRESNSGKMYVEDANGIALWGKIWGTNVWDDVTLPGNLLAKAQKWLQDSIKSATTITLNAVDLSLMDIDIDDIQVGDLVRVVSEPHELDRNMPCTKTHIEPGAPDKNTITLGASTKTLTRSISGDKSGQKETEKTTNSNKAAIEGLKKRLDTEGAVSGEWVPTVEGAGAYSTQTGRYVKIGDMAIISFSVYGTFAGDTTARIKITGCPITPADNFAAGGGNLSGYTAAANTVFTGWNIASTGAIYAVGQYTGTTETSKWGSTGIYQKASGDFLAAGTIAFKIGTE